MGPVRGRGLGFGRIEHPLGPCCPGLRGRPVVGPCTCEHRCGKENRRRKGETGGETGTAKS